MRVLTTSCLRLGREGRQEHDLPADGHLGRRWSAIWLLIYAYNNPGQAQTGLLNAIWVGLGGQPQTSLAISTAKLIDPAHGDPHLAQVGFAMVLLSSAIKGVLRGPIEAAASTVRASRRSSSRHHPADQGHDHHGLRDGLHHVLKIFDIVYVTTNGAYDTNVIANLFFNKLFAQSEAARPPPSSSSCSSRSPRSSGTRSST